MAFLDLCRLCGTDTLNIVRNAIFEGEGRDKKYAHKIAECLTLQVAVEDKLPKIMCGECSYKLDLLSEFRDKAYKTESQLLSKIDVNKVKAELPDVDDSLDLDNDDAGGDEDDFDASSPEMHPEPEVLIKEEERPAEKRRGRKPAAKRSLRETESEEEEEAPPKKRGRKPKQATAAAATTSPAAAPPKENTGKTRSACPACGTKVVKLDMHMCKVHGRPTTLICNLCPEVFTSGSAFTAHALTHNPNAVTCIVCCQVLDAKDKSAHMVDAHGFSACAKCDAFFANGRHLAQHVASAHAQRIIRCFVCRKRQNSRAELRLHLETHPRDFLCTVCGQSFISKPILRKHVLIHEEPRFECDFCGRKMRSRSAMLAHIPTHLPRSKILCGFCGKLFQSRATLRIHKNHHHADSEPKKYECLVCQFKFLQRNKLNLHMKLHRGELDHECDQCNRAFIRKDLLVRHRFKKHKIKEYKCLACNLEFELPTQLKIHNKQQHLKL